MHILELVYKVLFEGLHLALQLLQLLGLPIRMRIVGGRIRIPIRRSIRISEYPDTYKILHIFEVLVEILAKIFYLLKILDF